MGEFVNVRPFFRLIVIFACLDAASLPSARAEEGGPLASPTMQSAQPLRSAAASPSFLIAAADPARHQMLAQAPAPPQPAAQGQPSAQGQPPAPSPLVLQRTEILNFDGWVATCREFTDKTKGRVCSAQIEAQQSNNVVFVWTVSANEAKQFASVFQVPTGLLIGPGVEVRMGKASPRTVPFTSCEPGRCTASVVMDNNFIRDAQATESAEVVIRAVTGNNVQFNIPMKGFEKALGVLKGALK
jgi:invasion protein IalB